MNENATNRYWAIAEWVLDNPEKGLKEFPEVVKTLDTVVDRMTTYQEVQFIKIIVNMFTTWAKELPFLSPRAKEKKLEQCMDIVWMTMHMKHDDEIVIQEIKKQLPELKEELSFLQSEYSKLRNRTSYEWTSNPDIELPVIYSNLYKQGLICPKTTQEQFINAFSNKPASTITPITWIGQKNLLVYFLDSLYKKEKIPTHSQLWATAKICFTDVKHLAQLKENYFGNKSGKPKGHEVIDLLLKNSL